MKENGIAATHQRAISLTVLGIWFLSSMIVILLTVVCGEINQVLLESPTYVSGEDYLPPIP